MNRRQFVAAGIGLATAALSFAEPADVAAKPPTTAPTTQPIAGPYAATDPRSGAYAYNEAMLRGDVNGLLARMHATTPEQRRVATALARSDAALGQLLKVAEDKFGAETCQKVSEAMGDNSNAMLVTATVTVFGGNASIDHGGGNSTAMVRIEGQWKLDIADFLETNNSDDLMAGAKGVAMASRVLLNEVNGGVLATPEALLQRIEEMR